MKILLTGAYGQLGRCFCDRLPKDWDILATDRNQLDITELKQIKEIVAQYKPDIIVNAAAYTAVDKLETEQELGMLINAQGPKNLALVAKEWNCRLIHISTDYVFDGQKKTPYCEDDLTYPLNAYGKTKLIGEIAVTDTLTDAIIIRTAWVFSEYASNFVKTMLYLAKKQDELNIVSDQYGCPTYAGDLANAIIALINKNAKGGIYHFSGDREVTWSEFAEVIFAIAVKQGTIIKSPKINRITTQQYPTLAQRPTYSSLNCEKIASYQISPSDWQLALRNIMPLL